MPKSYVAVDIDGIIGDNSPTINYYDMISTTLMDLAKVGGPNDLYTVGPGLKTKIPFMDPRTDFWTQWQMGKQQLGELEKLLGTFLESGASPGSESDISSLFTLLGWGQAYGVGGPAGLFMSIWWHCLLQWAIASSAQWFRFPDINKGG